MLEPFQLTTLLLFHCNRLRPTHSHPLHLALPEQRRSSSGRIRLHKDQLQSIATHKFPVRDCRYSLRSNECLRKKDWSVPIPTTMCLFVSEDFLPAMHSVLFPETWSNRYLMIDQCL